MAIGPAGAADPSAMPVRTRDASEQATRRAPRDPATGKDCAGSDAMLPEPERIAGDRRAARTATEAALSQLLFLRKRWADWHDLDTLQARFVAGITAGQKLPVAVRPALGSVLAGAANALRRSMKPRVRKRIYLGDGWDGRGRSRSADLPRAVDIGYLSADFHMHATALLTGRFSSPAVASVTTSSFILPDQAIEAYCGSGSKTPARSVSAPTCPAARAVRQIHADGIELGEE